MSRTDYTMAVLSMTVFGLGHSLLRPELCAAACAAAADILLTPPPPIVTDRRAPAADRMSASRRRRFLDVFTSCCTPAT